MVYYIEYSMNEFIDTQFNSKYKFTHLNLNANLILNLKKNRLTTGLTS